MLGNMRRSTILPGDESKRPANDAELLAYHILHDDLTPMPEVQQQSFVDQTERLKEPESEDEQEEDQDSYHEPESEGSRDEVSPEPPATRRRIQEVLDDFPSAVLRERGMLRTSQEVTPQSHEAVSSLT